LKFTQTAPRKEHKGQRCQQQKTNRKKKCCISSCSSCCSSSSSSRGTGCWVSSVVPSGWQNP
jgi:hypothetical protein